MGVPEGGVISCEVDGVAKRGASARACKGQSYCKFKFQEGASAWELVLQFCKKGYGFISARRGPKFTVGDGRTQGHGNPDNFIPVNTYRWSAIKQSLAWIV